MVDDLNSINEDLSVDKDFVMKACLVLADLDDVKFEVDNFAPRNLKKNDTTSFPSIAIARRVKELKRSLEFTEQETEALLDYGYTDRETFLILSILRSDLGISAPKHVDYIFARTTLTNPKLRAVGLPDASARNIVERRDSPANLQLLDSVLNQEKSGRSFQEWLDHCFTGAGTRKLFLQSQYIPGDAGFSYGAIPDVWKGREEPLLKA